MATYQQWSQSYFVNDTSRDDIVVADNMDTKDLVRYTIDGMIEYFNEGSLDELREEVNTFDEELYEQLVDNVTSETITQGGQS